MKRFWLFIMLFIVLILAGCSAQTQDASPSPEYKVLENLTKSDDRVAVTDGKGTLIIVNPMTGRKNNYFPGTGCRYQHPSWAPNVIHLVVSEICGENAQLLLFDNSSELFDVIVKTYATDPSWSPDGQHIAFVSKDSSRFQISMIAVDPQNGYPTGEPEPLTFAFEGPNIDPSWSPDNQVIFSGFNRTTLSQDIYQMDPAKRTITQLIISSNFDETEPVMSPLHTLAYAAKDKAENSKKAIHAAIGIFPKEDGEISPLMSEPYPSGIESAHPAWDPEGTRLMYYSTKDPAGLWVLDLKMHKWIDFGPGVYSAWGSPY